MSPQEIALLKIRWAAAHRYVMTRALCSGGCDLSIYSSLLDIATDYKMIIEMASRGLGEKLEGFSCGEDNEATHQHLNRILRELPPN